MLRRERLEEVGYRIIWMNSYDDEFYLTDGSDYYFLVFYQSIDNQNMVDVHIIKDRKYFNPATFDINKVPDFKYLEDYYWEEVIVG